MSKIGAMYSESPSPSHDWYAVYVRHQNEYKISDILTNKIGIESLAPSRKVWKKRGGRVEVFKKPILPTYVFIKTDLQSLGLRGFYSIPGVVGFVKSCGVPAPIAEDQVMSLERLGSSERPVHEMEYMKLKPNDRVRVIDGPLEGAIGLYLRSDSGSGRFVVSIDLFQRSLVTELEAHQLKIY